MKPRRIRLASGEVIDADELNDFARVAPRPSMPVAQELATSTIPSPAAATSPRSDRELLDALMAARERLTANESRAFGDMHARFVARRLRALTFAQRVWAQEVAARVGLDVEAPGYW